MVFLLVAVVLGRIVRFEHIESLCEEKNITVSRMGEARSIPLVSTKKRDTRQDGLI
jgi:hypothetical protein